MALLNKQLNSYNFKEGACTLLSSIKVASKTSICYPIGFLSNSSINSFLYSSAYIFFQQEGEHSWGYYILYYRFNPYALHCLIILLIKLARYSHLRVHRFCSLHMLYYYNMGQVELIYINMFWWIISTSPSKPITLSV